MKNVFYFVIIAISTMHAQNKPFEVHGHRGARGVYPENSLEAFRYALNLGVDVLELDLVVNKDGQLVISHEPWMNPEICGLGGQRLPQKSMLSILKMSQDEVRQYDCGSFENPRFPEQKKMMTTKPLLRELVHLVRSEFPEKADSIVYNMEIKYTDRWHPKYVPDRESFLHHFMTEVESLGIENQVILQCFDKKVLRMAHESGVSYPLALLVQNIWGVRKNIRKLGFTPEYYSPYFKLLSSKSMKRIRKRGMKVVPWTVNELSDIEEMLELGVDGMISDYPERVLKSIDPK